MCYASIATSYSGSTSGRAVSGPAVQFNSVQEGLYATLSGNSEFATPYYQATNPQWVVQNLYTNSSFKKNCFHDSKQIQLTVAVPGARTRLQPYLSSDLIPQVSEPVWSSSKALGLEAEGPRFESASALLSLQKLWSVDIVSRLCSTQLINH